MTGVVNRGARFVAPNISAPNAFIVYPPGERFAELSADLASAHVGPSSIAYVAGIDDDLIRQIGYAILSELTTETAGGRLLVESLALSLADLSIEALASVACLSRFHFSRAFRAATGVPSNKYVSRRRLERAKALLARTDRSLVDVALSSQFSSQANFTRAFRRATGVTLGEFRRGAR